MPIVAAQAVPGRSGVAPHFPVPGLEALYLMDYETRNLLSYSEDFAKAISIAVSVTANAIVAPNGELTGYAIIEDGTSSNHHVDFHLPTSFDAGVHTFSAYMKAGTRTWGRLRINALDGLGPRAWFNLASGVIGTVDAAAVGSGMEPAGDGWYRCWVAISDMASGLSAPLGQIFLEPSDGATTYTGDGSSGIYAWGAQFSPGLGLTPYVPTTHKQLIYDYSGNGNDAYLGSVGAAGINPIGQYLWLPGTAGNSISTPNTTGGTAYWTAVKLDGTTVTGSTALATVTVGEAAVGAANVTAVRVYSDSGRTTLVAEADIARDAPGDVSQFYSRTTGELWTVNAASGADTNDPTWTGEGLSFDGVDDLISGMPVATDSVAVEAGAWDTTPADYSVGGAMSGVVGLHARYSRALGASEKTQAERAARLLMRQRGVTI